MARSEVFEVYDLLRAVVKVAAKSGKSDTELYAEIEDVLLANRELQMRRYDAVLALVRDKRVIGVIFGNNRSDQQGDA